ncbi:MaoC family dehydratase [Oceanicella actignis]|uniref:MaoC family dehydratase n=1 Tax=Oceanicella actignis TaxID=1189325 RepID=UPI0011E82DA1|nr:MaoC/PaaZ C-terminal domain-containing protein [Oceanicella actignis]TYO91302.1 MaoC dehydratase-like protein [Oceanicella actignis]
MSARIIREWTPTQAEFDAFARVSGDDNPIHVDPEFSARTRFGRTVSHGMLIYARLWAMLAEARPGFRQASQSMMFPNPAYAGEPVRLTVERIDETRWSLRAERAADGAALFVGEAEAAC